MTGDEVAELDKSEDQPEAEDFEEEMVTIWSPESGDNLEINETQ